MNDYVVGLDGFGMSNFKVYYRLFAMSFTVFSY